MDRLGFDTTYGGPKLLEVDGDRLPIAVLEGDEIQKVLEILSKVPDEPSRYTEDGFVESSDPSVFDSGKVEAETDGGVNLAANPEAVTEMNANPIKSAVSDIGSLRTIQTMLRVEKENDNRSSVIDRLEQRRNALQGSDEADEEPEEEAENDLSDAEMNLVSSLLNSGEAESYEAAKQMVQG